MSNAQRCHCVVKWVSVKWAVAPLSPWHPSDFGESEHICYSREPDLREVLNQATRNSMAAGIPVQPVAPLTPLPQEVPKFKSIRDLDRQCQWQYDQTVTKQQPSPLEDEQRKRAKTPPQPDPEDPPSRECLCQSAAGGNRAKEPECGCSQTRKSEEQKETDRCMKPDTPINVYTWFCLNTAKSKFSLVSPVAD